MFLYNNFIIVFINLLEKANVHMCFVDLSHCARHYVGHANVIIVIDYRDALEIKLLLTSVNVRKF